ncbi:MAG: ArsA-related P-loop ATPase [Candidatus Nanohaloarchaea archaeon]
MNTSQKHALKENSAFGITTFPEKSPVAEATRTVQHLSEKYRLDNSFLIVNYLLPEAENDFMLAKKSEQSRYLKELEENMDRPMIGLYEQSGEIESRKDVKNFLDSPI